MKLNSKLLITHAIIGAILLLVTGYYTDADLEKEKFQSIHTSFIAQLYQVDFAITNFLVGVEYDVQDLVANEIVRTRDDGQFTQFLDADEDTFEYNIGEKEQAIINVFNNYRINHPYANSVYMGRENGSFVRSHKRNRPTQYDPRERPWYELAVKNPDKVMRTAPYRSVTTPDVNIGTVKALVDEHSQVYGVVGIDITLHNLTEYISNISVGKDSYIVLLDDNGFILTGHEEALFTRYDEAGLDYFQVVMNNSTGYTSFEKDGAKNYLFYYTSPALDWKICAVVPVQEIDRQVSQFVNRMLWLLALSLFLLSALTAVGVRRFIVKPIKELERSTGTIIQTGDLDHRIAVKTGDEIGQLAASFNEMVESIKRAGEELRTSEEKYRSLVENINVGIFRSTPDGHLLHANPAAVKMLGYNSGAETMDVSMEDLYEDAGQRELLIRRLEQGEVIKDHELRLVKRDGTPIWASFSVTAQHDQDGTVKWLEGTIQDITARKQTEDALRRAHDELELRVAERTAELLDTNVILKQEIAERERAEEALRQAKETAEQAQQAAEAASRAKSAFLANMSHELRTPLNAILGFAQLMERSPDVAPSQQENLAIISRSGEHLLTLINDVLDFSKLEAGRAMLNEQDLDLYRLLDGLEVMFQLRAEDKGLQLSFDCAPDVPQYVRTDEGKLRQVLSNLLGNAIKFTYQGGVILRVRRVGESADRRISDELTDSQILHFEVEDTGVGIAPDEMDGLFDAFVQTASGTRSQSGTGLGLPISRQFVQLMGGDISVTSTLGKGSVFAFAIRVAPAKSDAHALQTVRHVTGLAAGQPTYHILVVEDQVEHRKLLVELLQPLGFEVREAVNGQQGIEMSHIWRPHLIFMDVRMPVMNGYEATRRIKATPEGQDIPIIAVTASVFEHERGKVLEAGCDDFIRKPFQANAIYEKIARHLGVQFVYQTPQAASAMPADDQTDWAVAALASLPGEWKSRLQQTSTKLDVEKTMGIVEQLRVQDSALADYLAGLVSAYRFDKLRKLFEERGERS